jgi:tRNA threonylcarbamoyladenosine biosynthesis protein TsaE
MPILNENSFEFISRSPEQTRRIGARLGSLMKLGDVICLYGDLGAGKTTFVQGIAQGWGSTDMVTSPTFVLINQYRRADNAEMYHLDAYRLKDANEAEVLDLNDLMDRGILLTEWPERIQGALPDEHLWIEMHWIASEQRRMVFLPHGQHYKEITSSIRQEIYKDSI